MIPVWIAIVFITLFSVFALQFIPQQQARQEVLANDVLAFDFLAYRTTVAKYLSQNPTTTGTIADVTLSGCSACLPLGYAIPAGRWSNYVDPASKGLFVFSLSATPSGTLDIIAKKTADSLFMGTYKMSTGKLISSTGYDLGIVLPSAISSTIVDGAIVIIGKNL